MATKYVAPSGSGGSDSNNGDIGTPWLTLAHALGAVSGGSTIYMRAGTYTGIGTITTLNGSAGAPTIISAYPAETVIFDGPGVNSDRVKFDGVSYMSLIGITVTDYNQGIYIDSASDHVTIQNCIVHGVGQEGIRVANGSNNCTITGCEVYDTAQWGAAPGGPNGEGIYVGGGSGDDRCHHITISNNNIHDTQDEGIELKGNTYAITVTGNTIDGAMTPGSGYSSGGGAIEIEVPTAYPSNPAHIITNNIIRNSPAKAIRIDTGATVTGNTIYDITSASTHGIQVDNSDGYTRTVADNIFVADTCSQTHVEAAINAADFTDDIIRVPAGSATWSTGIFTTLTKPFTFQGAGIGLTTITGPATTATKVLVLGDVCAANFVDISGFTFITASRCDEGNIIFYGITNTGTFEKSFRFHHNRLEVSVGGGGDRGLVPYWVWGLVDHNEFICTAATGSIQVCAIYGSAEGGDAGFTPWTLPTTMGTENAVYYEYNTFDYSGGSRTEEPLDGFGGVRQVIRYNTFIDIGMGWHGTDSGNRRGNHSVEVYGNVLTQNTTDFIRACTLRSGTGVFFDNTYSGDDGYVQGLMIATYRATHGGESFPWQYCDGTNWDFSFATNTCVTAGTANRFLAANPDTWGSSGAYTRYFDGSGSHGYPARDQVGRGHDQVLMPVYQWNNESSGNVAGPVAFYVHPGTAPTPPGNVGIDASNWLLANRDYYDYVALGSFNGTVGVTKGTLSQRPSASGYTNGVGFFATDVANSNGGTGILYVVNSNAWTVYYEPLGVHSLAGEPAPPPSTLEMRVNN